MSDRIPPAIEFLQKSPGRRTLLVMGQDLLPEVNPETSEVVLDAIWLSIAPVEPPASGHVSPDNGPHGTRCHGRDQIVHALGMEISTEALELGCQDYRIGPIDLLGRVTPSPSCPTDRRRTWNPDSGGIARGFDGPSDYVFSVAASADGSRIAAGAAGAAGALSETSTRVFPPSAGLRLNSLNRCMTT